MSVFVPPSRSTLATARQLSSILIAAGAALLLLVGCATPSSTTEGSAPAAEEMTDELSGELSVYAAASLQSAFEELTEIFTAEHPEVTFSLSFDGSSTLATQIIGGADADVFASADEANMQKIVDADLVEAVPVVFATSELVIVVAPGNPLGIATLDDLTTHTDGAAPLVVTCAAEVPCGAAAQTLLTRDGVDLVPASEEQNVTAVLTKVVSGEADAGLVYASDVQKAGDDVEGIAIANSKDAAGSYVIAPVAGSSSTDAADAFIEYVVSPEAQALFASLGFHTN